MYFAFSCNTNKMVNMLLVAKKGFGLGISALLVYKFKEYITEKPILNPVASEALSVNLSLSIKKSLPSRIELLSLMKSGSEYDILVIGGGATGCGVALDACTRGLKTALVEKGDYSSGTSSRSTKLIHGGVRYLQSAIMNFDKEQYHLVKEALHERAVILKNAPNASETLPILLPLYKWWQVPYFWIGIKMYDLVAGRELMKKSYYISKEKVLEQFPMLKKENLCGGIVYFDGQQDDARMNLLLALTAIRSGATCLNHVEVIDLLTNQDNEVCGAHVKDKFTGEEWYIKAKCVVNATGPFTDVIRKMDDKSSKSICQPASGVHIVLPDYYCSRKMGLIDPSTSDGRVIFFLPWQGRTIVGTTDKKCELTETPVPTQEDIDFIIKEVSKYFSDFKVRHEDVLSSWSGIRPLVLDPSSPDTQSLSRNHVVHVSDNKLVTIAGGKWTTYRAMARDAVDAVISLNNFIASKCVTEKLFLEGAEGWHLTQYIKLIQKYGLDSDVAEYLSRAYGNRAYEIAELATKNNSGQRLVHNFPYIQAEIDYSVNEEYACTAVDFLARRIRLAFLDVSAANSILPFVVTKMGDQLDWNKERRKKEIEDAKRFLLTMAIK